MRPEESALEVIAASSPFLLIAGGIVLALVLGIGTVAAMESGFFDEEAPPYPAPPPLTMDNMSMSTAPAPMANMPTATPPVATGSAINNHAASLPGRWSRSADCTRVMEFLADGTIINPNGQRGTWQIATVSPRQSILTISGGGTTVRAWFDPYGAGYQLTPMDGTPQFTITRC